MRFFRAFLFLITFSLGAKAEENDVTHVFTIMRNHHPITQAPVFGGEGLSADEIQHYFGRFSSESQKFTARRLKEVSAEHLWDLLEVPFRFGRGATVPVGFLRGEPGPWIRFAAASQRRNVLTHLTNHFEELARLESGKKLRSYLASVLRAGELSDGLLALRKVHEELERADSPFARRVRGRKIDPVRLETLATEIANEATAGSPCFRLLDPL